jgi:hypothetical protein
MKVKVKAVIHYRKYDFQDTAQYVIFPCRFDNDTDTLPILETELEVEIPDDFDPINTKIGILRQEKQRIQAEAHVKAENIEQQIQELLCIEDKSCSTAS